MPCNAAVLEQGIEYLQSEHSDGMAHAAGKPGWAYLRGFGVEPDLDRALELYNIAARSGMTYWQYLLAHAYEHGYLGLQVDDEQAAYWREYQPRVHIATYDCWRNFPG